MRKLTETFGKKLGKQTKNGEELKKCKKNVQENGKNNKTWETVIIPD